MASCLALLETSSIGCSTSCCSSASIFLEEIKRLMLKRPTEKHWKFNQPPAPFPQYPTSAIMLVPSGQGKTTSIVSMVLGPYSRVFDSIHVCSPSVFIDSAWEHVIEFSKSLKDCTLNADWDEAGLIELMEEQKKKVKLLKDAKTEKPIPPILVIIDDWADSPMLHSSTKILTTLMIRGRHLGVSCLGFFPTSKGHFYSDSKQC